MVHNTDAHWGDFWMLFMASHITKRGGIFYFRARVPTHLVSAYGRAIVSVSLRTHDPATAKTRAREMRVGLENELVVLEQGGPRPDDDFAGSVLYLSDSDIDAICLRYRARELAGDELTRIKGMTAGQHELDLDILESAMPALRRAYATGDLTEVYKSLMAFLKSIRLQVHKTSPSFERLARRFQQAELEVYEAIAKRRQGIAVDIPLVTPDGMTIDDVLKCWKRQKPASAQNLKTCRSFELVFEEFKSHCKAPTARLIKKADAVAFRNALSARGDRKPKTIAKQLSFLRAAFQCAVNDDELEANPFSGVKVFVPEQASSEKTRQPFTTDELKLIFGGPVYQVGFKARKSLGQACHWLPLLALFTGARLEELGQLDKADVVQEHTGAHICIRRALDKGQRTKNRNSVRNIPVHPTLIELGFLGFVEACSEGRIFPALRPDKYGICTTSFSTWFGRYLSELDISDASRVFHSFRHTFVQRCKERASVVPPEVREAIVGHMSAKTIEMAYGSSLYPLEPQAEALKHISWPELDLSHLFDR